MSAALLYVAVRRVDAGEAWRITRGASPGLLIAGMLGVNVGVIGMAMRWRLLTRGVVEEVPATGGFLQAILCAQAVNGVVPARAGDVVRIAWLTRGTGAGPGVATATMLADRALDILALTLIIAVGFPFVPRRGWVVAVGIAALGVTLILLAAWAAALVYRARGRPAGEPPQGRLRREWLRFATALGGVLTPGRAAGAAILTAAIWGTWALGALAVARAIGIHLGAGQILFVAAVLNVGLAIPSSPGFVGTYQWLIVSGAGLFGVAADPAFAFSVVLQLTWFVPQTLIGLALLPRLGLSVTGVRRRAAEARASDGAGA